MSVPLEKFGRDHWTTLLYLECRVVDHKGEPNRDNMRTDPDRHPGLVGPTVAGFNATFEHKKYPTRLKGGELLNDHDDWDCADDLEEAGLIEWNGTGIHPIFKFTDYGWTVAAALRKARAEGKTETFTPPPRPT